MMNKPPPEELMSVGSHEASCDINLQEKITELEAANRVLQRRRHEMEVILDGIADVMAVISFDFRITSVNKVFHRVFGEPHPKGRFCYEVFRQRTQPCVPCPAISAMESDRACREHAQIMFGGKKHHFEVTASPLRCPRSELPHILLLKRDLTLEKDYEERCYRAEKLATVGTLAAGVAHELNNPLTAVVGFAEGLRRQLCKLQSHADQGLIGDVLEYIAIIRRESQRCQEIVQSLLSFSRQTVAEFISVDLNEVVLETLTLLQNRLKEYPEGFICVDLEEALPTVRGDPSQLKQVVLNLILNALDASKSGESVTLSTFANRKNRVGLTVEDTGCGISAHDINKIFIPFFTTKPPGGGTGLGLSTCYNIVRNHGGEIFACSQEGFGSSFVVMLPREDRSC